MITIALLFAILLVIEAIAFVVFEICFPFILIWLVIKKIKEYCNESPEEKSYKGKSK